MLLTHIESQPIIPSRVVIIGASGVIGKALTRLLLDREVPVLTLSSADINLLNSSAAEQLAHVLYPTDSVVVLSGLPLTRGRGLEMMVANVEIGLTIAEAVAHMPVAQVIYMSSDAVYPRRIEKVHELTDTEPSDPYSAMHLLRERIFSNLRSMPVALLRSTQISSSDDAHDAYGPNRFRRTMFAEQRIALFGKGEETRDHILVQDVAAVIHRCLIHRSQGIINVATGRSLTFAEVANIVASQGSLITKIEDLPREVPITHRRFDTSLFQKMFSDFQFTPLEHGEAEIQERYQHFHGF